MHRVRASYGAQTRILAILSYDTQASVNQTRPDLDAWYWNIMKHRLVHRDDHYDIMIWQGLHDGIDSRRHEHLRVLMGCQRLTMWKLPLAPSHVWWTFLSRGPRRRTCDSMVSASSCAPTRTFERRFERGLPMTWRWRKLTWGYIPLMLTAPFYKWFWVVDVVGLRYQNNTF